MQTPLPLQVDPVTAVFGPMHLGPPQLVVLDA
jgi:hypothetical protein